MREYDTHTEAVPSLDRLPEEGVEAIHEAAMYLVEEVGIQLNHERALDRFEEAGASVDREENLVRAPRDLLMGYVEKAPSEFTLHGRGRDREVTCGGDGTIRAPGYGPPNIRTCDDGRRSSELDDYERLVKLVHAAEPLNCTGYSVCEPNDVDQAVKHYEMLKRSLVYSDQPVMGSTYGADRARASIEMVSIAVDDADMSRPYVAGLVNTVPPRSIDTKMLGGLMTYAEHGQPTLISSFTMAAASGPATLPGSMAQATAENLTGIALAQLVNEGAPVVFGVPSSNIDVRYGSLSIGSPGSALFTAFAGQMGRYYGVPVRGGGGLTDSKLVDYQAGAESAMLGMTTAFAGVDYVLHAAGIMESYSTISPEKLALDCETLRHVDRFEEGFPITDGEFPLEMMGAVDPAGHFLNERDTLKNSRE